MNVIVVRMLPLLPLILAGPKRGGTMALNKEENNAMCQFFIELYYLGIDVKRDKAIHIPVAQELEELIDNLKQSMLQDYRIAFSMIGDNLEEEARSTIAVWILKRLPIYGVSLSLF